MAEIGVFHADREGGFYGEIVTLKHQFNVKFIRVTERSGDQSPNFKLYSDRAEIGVAWEKSGKSTGEVYYSVVLDDPSFTAPINGTMKEIEGAWRLIWVRNDR